MFGSRRRFPSVVLALFGCTTTSAPDVKSPAGSSSPTVVKLHLGRSWYVHRGASLGLSPEEARARDAQFDENTPPGSVFWDEQMALDTASVWRVLCNECHPGKRSVAGAVSIPAPPDPWPSGPVRFFDKERSHRAVYLTIVRGGARENAGPLGPMPSFRGELSHEQIWGLVYFLEVASRDASGS